MIVEDGAPASADFSDRVAIRTVVVLCLGGLVAALMQTLMIPIQPELPQLLGTFASNASWVITATLLAASVAMPIAGRLADMFGKQRVLLVSAVVLVVGSLVCALANSLLPMLVGRTLQGMAMGFIPVGIAMMREVAPPHLSSMAIASMSATLGVGGAIGVPLAAWIAEDYDWHVLFWVSVGLAAAIGVAVATLVPHVHDANGGRLDVVGALGLAVGLVAILIAVSKGNDWGWGEPTTLGLLIGGLVVLLAWGWYETRHDDPLIDLAVTARRPVLLTNVAALAIGFGMMAQVIVLPQLLELPSATGHGMGQTLLQAGLWMAPGGVMMMLFAPVSSKLIDGLGAKVTLLIGATVLGLGYLAALLLMGAPWQLLIASMIGSAGVGIGYAAMPTLVMNVVPGHEAGAAVGLNALMRSCGGTIAAAAMGTVLASNTFDFGGHAVPTLGAFQVCFVFGAVAAFVGVAIAAGIPAARRGVATEAESAMVH
ncbi:MAG TPA: MFS transporter [Aldersonia sp.]